MNKYYPVGRGSFLIWNRRVLLRLYSANRSRIKREHRECSNNSILLSPTDNWEGKCIPVVRKAVWFDDHPSWHIEEHLKCAFLRSYLLPWIYVWILSTPYSNSLAVQISCMFQKECRLETFSTKALVCIVIFSLVVKTPNHSLAFVKPEVGPDDPCGSLPTQIFYDFQAISIIRKLSVKTIICQRRIPKVVSSKSGSKNY